MAERKMLDENEQESVTGGRMKFSGGNGVNQMGYLHPDGSVTIHPVYTDLDSAYKRSLALHMETDDEDYILSVLQAEGIVG